MTSPDPHRAPFGAFALSPALERLRRLPMALPGKAVRRTAESIVRRILMAGGRNLADVEVFPGQFARLHLRDNRCEKRVFAGAGNWDPAERESLREAIQALPADDRFNFVDAGANAGFYTLSVLADAAVLGRTARVVAIEPDPENRRRLEFNLATSDAASVQVFDCALGDVDGEVTLRAAGSNRGEVQISQDGEGSRVRVRPLLDLLHEAGLDRVDAMKIDIEGHEAPVLNGFFAESPRHLWPKMILLETRHDADLEDGASGVCRAHGYQLARQMRQNAVFVLPDGEMQ
ncbi:FkbM family methyltransferase [Maricaulis sp. CAU 1757]